MVSAYEDKALGLSENGEIFSSLKEKTFPKFVDHILKDSKSPQSEHWRPQYIHCDYCDIHYDIIGRMETFQEDLQYIAFMNNFTSKLPSNEEKLHVHPSGGKRYSKKQKHLQDGRSNQTISKTEKVIRYFSMLNSTQLNRLYRMYQIDFELFNYSVYPYVKNKM